MVNSFNEFCDKLLESGFSMGGGNSKGIYAIVSFDWKNPIPGCPIAWHTGDPDTDPWEWRMRVLEERDDIAYGKVFFGAGGYITRDRFREFDKSKKVLYIFGLCLVGYTGITFNIGNAVLYGLIIYMVIKRIFEKEKPVSGWWIMIIFAIVHILLNYIV